MKLGHRDVMGDRGQGRCFRPSTRSIVLPIPVLLPFPECSTFVCVPQSVPPLLGGDPLCGYSTVCSLFHLLKVTWVLSVSGL